MTKEILKSLRETLGVDFKVLRVEMVGPAVGSQLRKSATLATILALLAMLIYITFRFKFMFAVGAVIALMHDVIVTLGIFSLTFQEVSMPFIAGMLTLVGYSINDTIVIFDRVRENFKYLKDWGVVNLLNNSINQSLSRTINTSLTTLFPVLTLFCGVERPFLIFHGTLVESLWALTVPYTSPGRLWWNGIYDPGGSRKLQRR